MAASETIINTVHALQRRAAEGVLTQQEFTLGMQVLITEAEAVRQLESAIVPDELRLDPKQIEAAGDNVVILRPPRVAS